MFNNLKGYAAKVESDYVELFEIINKSLDALKAGGVENIPDYFPIQLENNNVNSFWTLLTLNYEKGSAFNFKTYGERSFFDYFYETGDYDDYDDYEVQDLTVSFPTKWFDMKLNDIMEDLFHFQEKAIKDYKDRNRAVDEEHKKQVEQKELALLAQLKAKYEGVA